MKRTLMRVSVFLFLVVWAISLAGCSVIDTDAMDQRVRSMLDCEVNGDVDGAFALLYPGVADEESFRAAFQQIQDIFPITADYTLTLQSYNGTKQIGTETRTVETAQYQVEFDAQVFFLYAVYISDNACNGFSVYRIIRQTDMIVTA